MNINPTLPSLHTALEGFMLKSMHLSNRLSVAPITRVSAQADGTPTREMLHYYRSFGEGGFGLIVSEGTYPGGPFSQSYAYQPGMATEQHQEGWQPLVEAVHRAGSAFILQLMHGGAISQYHPYTIAPSPVRPKGEMMPNYFGQGPYPMPKAMSLEDIAQVTDAFVEAAKRAQGAGFNGIEVHSANGYLLDQFITTYTNQREDHYGGSTHNRIRLSAQIVAAIKAAVSPSFIVGIRLFQTKVNDREYRWPDGRQEAEIFFSTLAQAGADYLHLASEGRDWQAGEITEVDGISLTQFARKLTGLPVVANGGMQDPARSAAFLSEGHADLVSLGRGAMANPDYPRRLASSRPLLSFEGGMVYPEATLDNTRNWLASRTKALR
jgi:2,4-dienoyl-CoA reductase-like NADH-dependent reductase (Old Yellow Enzyme family)